MQSRKFTRLITVFIGFLFLTISVSAQSETKQESFADISNQGTRVVWNTNVPYKSVQVTVTSSDGFTARRVFQAGETPSFDPASNRKFTGSASFSYELVFTPILAPGVEDQLKAARDNGTSEKVQQQLRKQGLLPAPMIESGSFKVINGTIYTKNDPSAVAERSEGPVVKTTPGQKVDSAGDTDIPTDDVQVINDDLVVVGSTCTGQDCVSSETFGFDTFRLKENNLRIHFQDTSNSASFPTSDWRIVANETGNGGASYLAFEDTDAATIPFRVEANAGNNALVVTDNGGNVGMGTLTPVVELQITDGDSPTLRLEQNGATGFTPQTWDIAGNETNFFVRDVTNSSRLPFRIRPGASDGTININSGGNVGIGFGNNTWSDNPLEVRNNNTESLAIVNTAGQLSLPKTGGGVRFPDGTLQTTAASGSGFGEINTASNLGAGQGVHAAKVGADLQFKSIVAGANMTVTSTATEITVASSTPAPLGPSYATTIFGGSGTLMPGGTATPTLNANKFSASTTGGFAVMNYNIPTNPNLVDPAGTNTVFRIRYRDSDGAAAGASVTVTNVTINTNSGNRTTNPIFTSTNATTTEQTVDVCMPGTFFSFGNLSNHLNIVLFSGAGTTAEVVFVQVYKSATCP